MRKGNQPSDRRSFIFFKSWGYCFIRLPDHVVNELATSGGLATKGGPRATKDLQFRLKEFEPFLHARPQKETSKQQHLKNVENAIGQIKNGKMEKVVVSRIKKVASKGPTMLLGAFKRLTVAHPEAFVYVICHKKFGNWVGASPEMLLMKTGNRYRTVALAGTQKFTKGKTSWNEKLLHEQALVTNSITSMLAKKGIKEIRVTNTGTARAGSMIHLNNEIEFTSTLSEVAILRVLHPTPAVCGLPRTVAKKFITKHERHKRRLYTGYMGISNRKTGNAIYFVNLRCMQVFDKHYELYLGGGITSASNPENEWAETELKATTLLNVIRGGGKSDR